MPNENEKSSIPQNKPTIHTTQLPIDLASKVIVKPANDSKMIQQPTFRTIQQPAQMRVVRMPTPSGTQIIQTQLVPQTILKTPMQQTGRSTITVSKSPAATYLPRVTATLSTIPQNKAGQQIRTPTPPVSATTMSPAFVRSITPRTSSPTAVLSQGGTAWVAGGNAMQVQVPTQLIRSTITQNRTHILQPSAVTVTNNAGNAQTITNIFGQQSQQQNLGGSTTISVTTSGGSQQTQQPTYVATVLPQRPQAATIVYTSQQQQPFTAIQGQVQRMGIGNPATNTRQVRPIQRIPTGIRVNTSSLSIRPNVPGLTPTTVLTTQNRGTSGLVAGTNTTISNTIPARIFQVQTSQTQSVTGSQQVLGQQNQKILQANVMTLPIIVNNRINPQVKNTLQPGIIAHVSKLQPGSVSSDGTIISNSITTTIPSNTMVASIQAGQQNQSSHVQVSQGGQGSYSTQTTQQVGSLSNQSGSQIITVSQQQPPQIIQGGPGNLHQGSNVVPLQISARSGNIPIKTITVSTANTGGLDSLHRNLSSNAGNMQATTIMPIAKLVQSQQQQNLGSGQNSNQPTSVFIQTRIPSSTMTTTNQVVSVSTPSSTIFSSAGATVFY